MAKAQVLKIVKTKPSQTIIVTIPAELLAKLVTFTRNRGLSLDDLARVSLQGVLMRSKFYDLDTKVGFGKYYGETMDTVIRLDPKYIEWALGKIEGMTLSLEATILLADMLECA